VAVRRVDAVSARLFILIETIPRVSDASDYIVMTLSLVAFVPLAGVVVMAGRSARG
jgi:hypothetical protein